MQYLRNGSSSRKGLSFFTFNWDAAGTCTCKKNIFAAWEASLKLGGSCGVRGKRAVASSLPFASQRSLPFTSGRKTSLREKVGGFLPLEEMQKGDERLGYTGSFADDGWNLYCL